MLSFAGEAGDGVIVLAGISEDAIRGATSRVTAGAAAAGRDAPKVATGLFCYVGDDWRDHLIQARPYAALYAIRHRDNLIADGLAVPEPGPIAGIYPDLSHAEDWDRAVDATSWSRTTSWPNGAPSTASSAPPATPPGRSPGSSPSG